jgi:hypothetical protein
MKKTILLVSIFLCHAIGGFAQEVLNIGNAGNSNFGGIANVSIDRSSKYMVSSFQIGISHVTDALQPWGGNSVAIDRMFQNMDTANISFQNVHIMGWGCSNPWPSKSGPMDFTSLDRMITRIQKGMNKEKVIITLCTAPGWMKVGGEDWNMNAKVAKEYYTDFAILCQAIALKYPEVKYFQVWNELKGWWVNDIQGFTEFYNVVYDSLKSIRPDALIGGPYMGVGLANGGTFSTKINDAFDYFFKNMHGADFVCFDGWLTGWPPETSPLTTEEAMMNNTACFGKAVAQIKQKTNLPVWISEMYCAVPGISSNNMDFVAANHASVYFHCLINKTDLSLNWDPFGFFALFTNPKQESGAQPTKHFDIVSIFNKNFATGEQLYTTTCNFPDKLDVLASATKTLLINKTDQVMTVNLCSQALQLEAYEIKLLEDNLSCVSSNKDIGVGKHLIYPNPVKDFLIVSVSQTGIFEAQIVNASGTTVRNLILNSSEIDVSDLASGMYLIRIKVNQEVFTQKFIKRN